MFKDSPYMVAIIRSHIFVNHGLKFDLKKKPPHFESFREQQKTYFPRYSGFQEQCEN